MLLIINLEDNVIDIQNTECKNKVNFTMPVAFKLINSILFCFVFLSHYFPGLIPKIHRNSQSKLFHKIPSSNNYRSDHIRFAVTLS